MADTEGEPQAGNSPPSQPKGEEPKDEESRTEESKAEESKAEAIKVEDSPTASDQPGDAGTAGPVAAPDADAPDKGTENAAQPVETSPSSSPNDEPSDPPRREALSEPAPNEAAPKSPTTEAPSEPAANEAASEHPVVKGQPSQSDALSGEVNEDKGACLTPAETGDGSSAENPDAGAEKLGTKPSTSSGSKKSSRVSIAAGPIPGSKKGSVATIAFELSPETNGPNASSATIDGLKSTTPSGSKKPSRASLSAGSGSRRSTAVALTESKHPDGKKSSMGSITTSERAASARRLSSAKKEARVDNCSLTERLYAEQIRSGTHAKLASVVVDQEGNRRLVNPGCVVNCHTVHISLTASRALPREQCGRSEHNCLTEAKRQRKRQRAATAAPQTGQYPDFMKITKLNEFVAASIIEKLRLKGLAMPLHEYRGHKLSSSILAEMVTQPKKNVTDRYYFGYVPPPNRPRYNVAFRRYLQQFQQRYAHRESDVNYSVALENVRVLADLRENNWSPLCATLAEVVRAQEEPGFGTRQIRQPLSATA